MTDERRERYAAAILAAGNGESVFPGVAAEAAMAVADEEQQEMADGAVRFTAAIRRENERLRTELKQMRVRVRKAERAVNLLSDAHRHSEQTEAEQASHAYLSTGCLHGEHGYCQSHTGLSGAKTPAVCKWCKAPCQCPCHRSTTVQGA